MRRMTSVRGKVVVITGGARGVGEELARRLHAKGATLVLTDLDEGPLAALAGDLGEDRVLTVVADVSDLKSMQGVAEQLARGELDLVLPETLANNIQPALPRRHSGRSGPPPGAMAPRWSRSFRSTLVHRRVRQ